MASDMFNSEARLSWVLAALAGVLGATAYTHSAGYFVTFMTGNAQRAVLGYFRGDVWLSISAGLLLVCFVVGVVVASVCRRYLWVAHPHGPTVLTTFSLFAATAVDVIDEGWEENFLDFAPIMLVVFGVGALNTSFVKDGEVSVPLSYVTGTLVKMGQGIERHIAGGKASDWLGYFLLFASFVVGATVGGFISLVVNGTWMLVVASAVCALTTGYTYFHSDRRALLDD
ncbi:MAG: YoaK family protein [Mycobacterium sp.]